MGVSTPAWQLSPTGLPSTPSPLPASNGTNPHHSLESTLSTQPPPRPPEDKSTRSPSLPPSDQRSPPSSRPPPMMPSPPPMSPTGNTLAVPTTSPSTDTTTKPTSTSLSSELLLDSAAPTKTPEEPTSGTLSSPARPLLPGLTPSPSDLDTLDARGTGARTEENASTSRLASSLSASAQLARAVPTAKSKCCISFFFLFPGVIAVTTSF